MPCAVTFFPLSGFSCAGDMSCQGLDCMNGLRVHNAPVLGIPSGTPDFLAEVRVLLQFFRKLREGLECEPHLLHYSRTRRLKNVFLVRSGAVSSRSAGCLAARVIRGRLHCPSLLDAVRFYLFVFSCKQLMLFSRLSPGWLETLLQFRVLWLVVTSGAIGQCMILLR